MNKLGEYLGVPVLIIKDRECLNATTKLAGEPLRYRPLDWWTCIFPDEENPRRDKHITYLKNNQFKLWHEQVKILYEWEGE